jgi:hypothetical protein
MKPTFDGECRVDSADADLASTVRLFLAVTAMAFAGSASGPNQEPASDKLNLLD